MKHHASVDSIDCKSMRRCQQDEEDEKEPWPNFRTRRRFTTRTSKAGNGSSGFVNETDPPLWLSETSDTSESAAAIQQQQQKNRCGFWTGRKQPLVQVLPGSQMAGAIAPPEPTEPPPIPCQIVKLLVIGEPRSGKTTLVKQFLYRQQTPLQQQDATRNMSMPSVEYHKKDISYWCSKTEYTCVRVQLWDVSLDIDKQHEAWEMIMDKSLSGIVLVVSIENGYEALITSIHAWKHFLKESFPSGSLPPMTLLVNKHDILATHQEDGPIDTSSWIRLGSKLAELCQKLGFASWYLTSSCCSTNDKDYGNVEDAFMDVIKSVSLPRVKHAKTTKVVSQGGLLPCAPVVEAQAVPMHSFATYNKELN